MMRLIITAILSLYVLNSVAGALNEDVMDRLASQIPVPTTPKQMHEAVERYSATVEMFEVEASKYRVECYRMFSNRRAENGGYFLMVYGTTPNKLCDHLATKIRRGHPVPEIQMILNGIDD